MAGYLVRRGQARHPGVERLEGRALLNASIDVAADGSLVCRLGPDRSTSLEVRRQGDVYTFLSASPIDVASNAAGLTVAGSGTSIVTVAGPSSLRIEAESDDQGVAVRSTGVPTTVDLGADGATVVLGDDGGEGSGGLAALAGRVSVVAARGTSSNRLTISDGASDYDPEGTLRYIVSATTVTAEGIDGFAGVSYSGLSSLRLSGTTSRTAPSALYLIKGTADGTDTTVDATGGFGRDFSIVGMSSDPSSRLALLSAGEANVWAAYVGGPTVVAGGSRTSIWIQGVRDAARGLHSSFLVDASAGGVELNVGPYWGATGGGASTFWMLQSGNKGPSPFSRLQDHLGPGEAGLFYRPGQVESLTVDARGGSGRSSLLVDFYGGDPLPSASPGWGRGLSFIGPARPEPRLGYAMGLVGAPPAGAFAEETHVAMPNYRGAIELTKADGSKRYVSYRLAEGSHEFNDGVAATSFRRVERYDGLAPEVRADSDLKVTPGWSWAWSWGNRYALEVTESNPAFRMAVLTLAEKVDVGFLRGSVPGETRTTLDYAYYHTPYDAGWSPKSIPTTPTGLRRISIENVAAGGAQVVRLIAAPQGVAATATQGPLDSAVVDLDGVATAASVSLRGGGGTGKLYVDATGVLIDGTNFVDPGGGLTRMSWQGAASPVDFRGYAGVEVYNRRNAAPILVDGLAFPTAAGQMHADVAAAVLRTGLAGASAAELSATIEWGDGAVDYATFRPIPGAPGTFRIVGSHAYAAAGVAAPLAWVAGTLVESQEVGGLTVTYHTPVAPTRTSARPSLTIGLVGTRPPYASTYDPLYITNQVRPTFEGASQLLPGPSGHVSVDVYAALRGGSSILRLGTTTVAADGKWSLASAVDLPDGVYDVYAVSTSVAGGSQGVAQGTPRGITIATQGPQILGIDAAPREGKIFIKTRAPGSMVWSGKGASLTTAAGRGLGISEIGTIPTGDAPPHETTWYFRLDEPLAPGVYLLTLKAAGADGLDGIFDNAGNRLDGAFDGTFPSGGSNTGQDFRARLTIGPDGLLAVGPA